MEDFILETEIRIKVKPVSPKTGLTQRGPYEKNMSLTTQKKSAYFYGTSANIDTMAANALSVLTRQWGLLATEPAQGVPVAASSVADVTATLNGLVHDHGTSTVVTFEYGTTAALGTSTAAAESPLTGDAWQTVSLAISSLTAETQYYFRVKMVSGGVTVWSEVATFKTSA